MNGQATSQNSGAVPAAVRAYLAGIGAKGGAAGTGAAKARTTEQARAAVGVRWARYRAARQAAK